jgi:hypothetical protein
MPPMTAEKWRADLDFFERELPKRHKNAFHAITRERFAAEVASLRAKAGQANDDEMIVGLMRIAALIGDGHTYVRLPSSIHQFPVTVANIEGIHRVVRAADLGRLDRRPRSRARLDPRAVGRSLRSPHHPGPPLPE